MADIKQQPAVEPKVVPAVGVSANSSLGGLAGKARAARIEEAMRQEVIKASGEGLRVNEDAKLIRERMMAARQAILDEGAASQVPPTKDAPPN